MQTVKLVRTITHRAPMMDECGEGLRVYQGYDPTYEDGYYQVECKWIKEFELPEGFSVAPDQSGAIQIWDASGRMAELLTYKDGTIKVFDLTNYNKIELKEVSK